MLTCVYHPVDAMRVLEEEEAAQLQATGMWFDCPAKAKKYRDKVVEDMNKSPRAEALGAKSDKAKEKRHER